MVPRMPYEDSFLTVCGGLQCQMLFRSKCTPIIISPESSDKVILSSSVIIA